MCIICLEFNKTRDIRDARIMIEAARREVDVIPEEHLKKVEKELEKRQGSAAAKPEALEIP